MLELTVPFVCAMDRVCLKEGEQFRVLDMNRLESAIGNQWAPYELDEQCIASVYRSLVQNHPFENGNKRTAVLIMYKMAESIGRDVVISPAELTDFTYKLAMEGGSLISVNSIANKLFGLNLEESIQYENFDRSLIHKDEKIIEEHTEEVNRKDIEWLKSWMDLDKNSYLKQFDDKNCKAHYVFDADVSKFGLDNFLRDANSDVGILTALRDRGFKVNVYQGPFTYKTVGQFNGRTMSRTGSGYDRTLPNRIQMNITWTKSLNEASQQTALKSNGVYSIMKDKWIKEPVAEDIPEIDEEEVEKQFRVWEDRYYSIIGDSVADDEELVEAQSKKKLYIYDGPVYRFKRFIKTTHLETLATTLRQAANNFKFKAAREIGYDRADNTSIEINDSYIVVDDFYKPEDDYVPTDLPYHKLCPKCGKIPLNDNGECPLCDLGDDSVLDESISADIQYKIDEIEDFIEDIYDLRKTSIKDEGEYSIGNQVFKLFRSRGYLDNLKDIKNALKTKGLSLE